MTIPIFDCQKFKKLFSYFNDFECDDIELRWDIVELYLPIGYCYEGKRAFYLWCLVTAHLLYLDQMLEAETAGSAAVIGNIVKSASAGDTSVTYERIKSIDPTTDLDAFLQLSAYGLRALTILRQERLTDMLSVMSNPLCGRAI